MKIEIFLLETTTTWTLPEVTLKMRKKTLSNSSLYLLLSVFNSLGHLARGYLNLDSVLLDMVTGSMKSKKWSPKSNNNISNLHTIPFILIAVVLQIAPSKYPYFASRHLEDNRWQSTHNYTFWNNEYLLLGLSELYKVLKPAFIICEMLKKFHFCFTKCLYCSATVFWLCIDNELSFDFGWTSSSYAHFSEKDFGPKCPKVYQTLQDIQIPPFVSERVSEYTRSFSIEKNVHLRSLSRLSVGHIDITTNQQSGLLYECSTVYCPTCLKKLL